MTSNEPTIIGALNSEIQYWKGLAESRNSEIEKLERQVAMFEVSQPPAVTIYQDMCGSTDKVACEILNFNQAKARIAELEAESAKLLEASQEIGGKYWDKVATIKELEARLKEAESEAIKRGENFNETTQMLASCIVDLADEYQSFDIGVTKHTETIKLAKQIMEGKWVIEDF